MSKKKKKCDPGPWHLVSRITGKHVGPFSTELDASMARAIATSDWSTGVAMDREGFDAHLADLRMRSMIAKGWTKWAEEG